MTTPTYTLITRTTLSSLQTQVTLSSIPSIYRDLVLVTRKRLSGGSGQVFLRFNSDSGNNYFSNSMSGANTSVVGAYVASDSRLLLESQSGTNEGNPSISITNIMDYSTTDRHTTVLNRHGRSQASPFAGGTEMSVNRWANTAAVSTIDIFPGAHSFAIGATFSLYGVLA